MAYGLNSFTGKMAEGSLACFGGGIRKPDGFITAGDVPHLPSCRLLLSTYCSPMLMGLYGKGPVSSLRSFPSTGFLSLQLFGRSMSGGRLMFPMITGRPWFKKLQLRPWNFAFVHWLSFYKLCYNSNAKWEQGIKNLCSFFSPPSDSLILRRPAYILLQTWLLALFYLFFISIIFC